MARIIPVTAYARDTTQFSSASPMGLNVVDFVRVTNATTSQKKSVPSASGSINTAIVTNEPTDNSSENHDYLVAETLAALVTASE